MSLPGFKSQGQPGSSLGRIYAPPGGAAWVREARLRPALVRPSRSAAILEVALSVSGAGLALFMVMHLGLLFSVLLSSRSMDALATFLERYYLLQAVAPPLILLAIAHIIVAARKAPTTFRQQWVLLRQMRNLRHLDTWTWAAQLVSAAALLALGAIHLWVILTDLPIQAAKSGARVYGTYLWFYVPFILLVETHASMGLYRIAVKWGFLARRWAHIGLTVWTAIVLALGFAILVTLYWIGAQL